MNNSIHESSKNYSVDTSGGGDEDVHEISSQLEEERRRRGSLDAIATCPDDNENDDTNDEHENTNETDDEEEGDDENENENGANDVDDIKLMKKSRDPSVTWKLAFQKGTRLMIMAQKLTERTNTMSSLRSLMCHVPLCVLNQIAQETTLLAATAASSSMSFSSGGFSKQRRKSTLSPEDIDQDMRYIERFYSDDKLQIPDDDDDDDDNVENNSNENDTSKNHHHHHHHHHTNHTRNRKQHHYHHQSSSMSSSRHARRKHHHHHRRRQSQLNKIDEPLGSMAAAAAAAAASFEPNNDPTLAQLPPPPPPSSLPRRAQTMAALINYDTNSNSNDSATEKKFRFSLGLRQKTRASMGSSSSQELPIAAKQQQSQPQQPQKMTETSATLTNNSSSYNSSRGRTASMEESDKSGGSKLRRSRLSSLRDETVSSSMKSQLRKKRKEAYYKARAARYSRAVLTSDEDEHKNDDNTTNERRQSHDEAHTERASKQPNRFYRSQSSPDRPSLFKRTVGRRRYRSRSHDRSGASTSSDEMENAFDPSGATKTSLRASRSLSPPRVSSSLHFRPHEPIWKPHRPSSSSVSAAPNGILRSRQSIVPSSESKPHDDGNKSMNGSTNKNQLGHQRSRSTPPEKQGRSKSSSLRRWKFRWSSSAEEESTDDGVDRAIELLGLAAINASSRRGRSSNRSSSRKKGRHRRRRRRRSGPSSGLFDINALEDGSEESFMFSTDDDDDYEQMLSTHSATTMGTRRSQSQSIVNNKQNGYQRSQSTSTVEPQEQELRQRRRRRQRVGNDTETKRDSLISINDETDDDYERMLSIHSSTTTATTAQSQKNTAVVVTKTQQHDYRYRQSSTEGSQRRRPIRRVSAVAVGGIDASAQHHRTSDVGDSSVETSLGTFATLEEDDWSLDNNNNNNKDRTDRRISGLESMDSLETRQGLEEDDWSLDHQPKKNEIGNHAQTPSPPKPLYGEKAKASMLSEEDDTDDDQGQKPSLQSPTATATATSQPKAGHFPHHESPKTTVQQQSVDNTLNGCRRNQSLPVRPCLLREDRGTGQTNDAEQHGGQIYKEPSVLKTNQNTHGDYEVMLSSGMTTTTATTTGESISNNGERGAFRRSQSSFDPSSAHRVRAVRSASADFMDRTGVFEALKSEDGPGGSSKLKKGRGTSRSRRILKSASPLGQRLQQEGGLPRRNSWGISPLGQTSQREIVSDPTTTEPVESVPPPPPPPPPPEGVRRKSSFGMSPLSQSPHQQSSPKSVSGTPDPLESIPPPPQGVRRKSSLGVSPLKQTSMREDLPRRHSDDGVPRHNASIHTPLGQDPTASTLGRNKSMGCDPAPAHKGPLFQNPPEGLVSRNGSLVRTDPQYNATSQRRSRNTALLGPDSQRHPSRRTSRNESLQDQHSKADSPSGKTFKSSAVARPNSQETLSSRSNSESNSRSKRSRSSSKSTSRSKSPLGPNSQSGLARASLRNLALLGKNWKGGGNKKDDSKPPKRKKSLLESLQSQKAIGAAPGKRRGRSRSKMPTTIEVTPLEEDTRPARKASSSLSQELVLASNAPPESTKEPSLNDILQSDQVARRTAIRQPVARNFAARQSIARKSMVARRSMVGRKSVVRRTSRMAFGAQSFERNLLPRSMSHHSSLLFVDISGFTKLSTMLDPEELSKAINSYFELILVEVEKFGGDVLKFAGDAIFVEWTSSSVVPEKSILERPKLTLEECVQAAALCGSSIVNKCSDYPVHNAHNVEIATLNVHCGIAVGEIVGVHVGDYYSRREYVFLGDPILQVSEAEAVAAHGELACSPQALAVLKKSCTVDYTELKYEEGKPTVIARNDRCFFTPANRFEPSAADKWSELVKAVVSWQTQPLKSFHDLVALYTHSVIAKENTPLAIRRDSARNLREERRAVAELRNVFVMFISPQIPVRITGREQADRKMFARLNDIINLATQELNRFKGHLRQFIVDDKGLVLIATFGLRGSTFPNMVAERALPCTMFLHGALKHELEVDSKIGATIGNAYCGLVGGLYRHEYAVLGPSVNLAARLMCSADNPGILVDEAVRRVADRSYAFNALPPVKAKGYANPVPIYEPLSPLERSWGRVQPYFVGRTEEMAQLIDITKEMSRTICPPKFVFMPAESGLGKSTMVVHSIEVVRKVMATTNGSLLVTKSVSSQSDKLIPFGIFRSILTDVLSFLHESADGASAVSDSSFSVDMIDWESISCSTWSGTQSQFSGFSQIVNLLESICEEINAPPVFIELVCHHILGGAYADSKDHFNLGATRNLQSLVSFMAKVISRCSKDARLVIMALDDVHNMDALSWSVVEELFHNAENILFICASRPLTTYKLNVSKEFWSDLETKHKEAGRFIQMNLTHLKQDELKSMIAKTLGLQEKDVTVELQTEVFAKSGGNPHFANEILDIMKSQGTPQKDGGASSGSGPTPTPESVHQHQSFCSVQEVILFRLDSLSASVRNVLNVAAVLGSTFELMEVLSVLHKMMGEDKSSGKNLVTAREVKNDLDALANLGVLRVVYEEFDEEDFDTDDEDSAAGGENWSLMELMYDFTHELWRTTILNLLLDSRKKDIHRVIATTLESRTSENAFDYVSRMKLFEHWKAAGEGTKAASLALSVGALFEQLGLYKQSINLYEDTLDMWRGPRSPQDTDTGRGFSDGVIWALSPEELENVSKLMDALTTAMAVDSSDTSEYASLTAIAATAQQTLRRKKLSRRNSL